MNRKLNKILVLILIFASIGIASAEITSVEYEVKDTGATEFIISGEGQTTWGLKVGEEVVIRGRSFNFDTGKDSELLRLDPGNYNVCVNEICIIVVVPDAAAIYLEPPNGVNNYCSGTDTKMVWNYNTGQYEARYNSTCISPDATMPPVYHAPTAVPTPEITPTPTPSPTPTPTPTPILVDVVVESTPVPEVIQTPKPVIQMSVPSGRINFDSNPPNATILIDGEPMKTRTPTRRDFTPKGYNITMVLPGYVSISKNVIVRDLDDQPFFVDFVPENKTEEPTELKFSSVVEPIPEQANISENTTNATTLIVSEKPQTLSLFLMSLVVVLVAVSGYFYVRHFFNKEQNDNVADVSQEENDQDDRPTEAKILDLLTTKGIAKTVKVEERTVQRVFKKLREENRFPF